MLAEEGYDVVGVTCSSTITARLLRKKGACCAGRDIHDARRVAEAMGFPHYVLDYENMFREAVIDGICRCLSGRCNPGSLHPLQRTCEVQGSAGDGQGSGCRLHGDGSLHSAQDGGGGARISRGGGCEPGPELFPVLDHGRAILLSAFSSGRVSSKAETRALAHALRIARRRQTRQSGHLLCPDKRRLCGGHRKLRPGSADPGEIVDCTGHVLGTHRGVIHYTIGQRKGLGIGGLEEPITCVKLDPATVA